MTSRPQHGFTLMEAVVVLITLSIVAAMAAPMVTNLVRGPESARRLEAAALAQQQCAERVLAAKNAAGYLLLGASSASTVCDALTDVDGVMATVAITDKTGGTCPAGLFCKEVVIGAKDKATSVAIGINAITLMVAR